MANKNTSPLAMGRMQKGSIANKKKKKDEEERKAVAQKKPQSSSVSKMTQQQRQNQKSYGTTQPRVTQKQPTPRARTSTQQRSVDPKETRRQESARNMRTAATRFASEDRRTAAQAQKMNMPTAEEQRRSRENMRAAGKAIGNSVRETLSSDNTARMQRQKSGIQTEEDKRYNEQRNQRRIEVAKNTGRAAKKGVQDTLTGYGKTLADVDEMAKSSEKWTEAKASKLGIDENDSARRAKIEDERQRSIKEARRLRLDLGEKQEKRQKEFDEATKNATGLEKAWYGAVESGTGMATDMAVGALTGTGQVGALASMGIRSYGTTRGQAEKEGATENEDRLYSLLSAGKEVGTEMMFQGAGLAKSAFSGGKVGLSLADRAANRLTRNMTGRAADATAAGIRLLGGTAEENAEELAGWGLDPIIKEFAYGRNVRQREAKAALKQESDAIRANITSEEDARSAAAYLNSDRFIEEYTQQYKDAGLKDAQAREAAEQMREYLTASLSGDIDRMAELEDSIAATMSGRSLKDWLGEFDKGELMDTFASTSLLTLTTGLPAGISTAAKGSAIRDSLGSEGIRELSETAINFEDGVASLKAQAARDRIDEGKELTSTQVYDLAQAQAQQVEKDVKRSVAASGVAETRIKNENYVMPELSFGKDGSVAGDEVIAANYVKESNAATDIIEDLMKQEGSESLTDTEVQNGSRAIAGFKTGAFTIADANALNYTNTTVRTAFSEATGIDLNQYVVKDSQGNIDIPKTNAATKDALFAMAADNYVKTAEAETANWMDNTKGEVVTEVTSRMGAQGSIALQAALDNIDERDRSTYMLHANAADMMYQTARNMGTEWANIKNNAVNMFPGVDESTLKAMYQAGLEDRAVSSSDAHGRQVKMGEAISKMGEKNPSSGNIFIDTEYPPKGSVVRVFSEIASNLGVDIHLVDDLRTGTGTQANGQYVNGAIYINVRSDFEKNVGYIFMHEVTHHLKIYAPEQFNALENLVRERWFAANPEEMQNEIAKRIDLYRRNGQNLSEEEALEEIIADAAHEFINDSNFARQAAETDPSLAKAVLESIKNALRAIRRILSLSNLNDETHMNSLFSYLGILDEAENLWLDAYTQAVKNRAAVGIDEWQDRANGQSPVRRLSASDTTSIKQQLEEASDELNGIKEVVADVDVELPVGMSNNQKKKKVYDEYKKLGFQVDIKGYGIVLLGKDEISKAFGYVNTDAEYAAFYVVPKVLKRGIKLEGHENHKTRGHSTATFAGPVKINGIRGNAAVVVDETGKNHYKAHRIVMPDGTAFELVDTKKEATLSGLTQESQGPANIASDNNNIPSSGTEYKRNSISDTDYMSAVESGDMETAQRMVDEVAAKAGYNIKVYHGTANGGRFNIFDPKKLNNSKLSSYIGQGFYFTNSREGAEEYTVDSDIYGNRSKGKAPYLYEGYLKLQNPIEINENSHNLSLQQIRDIVADGNKEWFFDRGIAQQIQNKQVGGTKYTKDEILRMSREQKINVYAQYLSESGDREALSNLVDAYAFDKQEGLLIAMQAHTGHDGIHWHMKEGLDQFVVFDSSQFKESAPVTYDDNGNVIPLSERFNQSNPDIRYSVPSTADYKIGETLGDEPIGVHTESEGENSITVRYSIPTEINAYIKGDGKVTSVRLLRDGFMKGRGKERKAVNSFLDALGEHMKRSNDLYKYLSLSDVQNATVTYRRDADGNPTSVIMSCQVQNGEYEINYDFSTICKKRKAFQDIIEDLFRQTDLDTLDLTEENIFKINRILEEYGFEIACPICFVEARRYANKEYADKIVNTWNAEVEKVNPDAEYFDFANSDPSTFDYVAIDEALNKAKITDKMDFADKCRVLVNSGAVFQKKMQQSDVLTDKGITGMKAMSNKQKNLFGYMKGSRGASAPKEIVSFNAYNGEIENLNDTYKGMSLVDFLYSIGGARLQSFSDFQIENVYDYIQLIAGMAARELPAHAYTKEVAFARLFGMTGMKINLSLVCDVDPNVDDEHAGLTKNEKGEWVYNLGSQSFKMEDAEALQSDPRYSKNVGTIMVGLSDAHIWMSLDDDRVRYIIPYHKSGLPNVIQSFTHLAKAEDYTKYQNTCQLSVNGIKKLKAAGYDTDIKALYEKNGKSVKKTMKALNDMLHAIDYTSGDVRKATKLVPKQNSKTGEMVEKELSSTGDFNVYDDVSKTKNPRKTAENYIAYCFENGYMPLFFEFAGHKNYYKMIFDFNVYDSVTGRYAPQGAVKNIYPGVDLTKGQSDYSSLFNEEGWQEGKDNGLIDEYLHERDVFHEKQDRKMPDVISEIKANVLTDLQEREEPETRWSISETAKEMDADYMDAVNSNDMDKAQELVDEAARMAGMRVVHRWHGSMNADFTVFSKRKANVEGNSGAGFYFTTNEDDAINHYKDSEGADNFFKVQSFADYLMQFEEEWNGVKIDSDETAKRIATEELNKNPGVFDVYLNYKNPYVRDYRNSTNIYDDIIEGFDESLVDRDDYDTEEDYEEARYMEMDDYLFEAIDDAVRSAYDYLEENYDYFEISFSASELASNIVTEAVETGVLTWEDIMNAIGLGDVTLENDDRIGDEVQWGATELTRAIIEGFGYDAVEDKEVDSKFGQLSREMMTGTEHIIVFRPEQIKLSDPVTYADDGSIIPLSQRFDPNNDDIRYSLPTQDADGKILTNGQMEYFKNSKARDAQGRLMPVYHGTFRGPRITIFEGDRDGVWFTSDRSIAEDYSMGYEMGIPGAMYGDVRNPYDSDDEYFAKKGIRIEQNSNGDWVAAINRNGREHYWGAAETKEELIDSLYEANENEELFDSQFTLRDVYPVYLNLENPKIIECNGSMHDDINGTGMTTRELAAEAMAEGYDGIIFRDVVDPFESIDVYVAFSSNQIKDINNENPTENPDIRYSIVDDEEAISRLAYEDAMDDSYEALARYEEMLDDPNAEQYFSRPFKEEDVTKFFDSLRAEDAVPSADPSFEEDRVRRAKSKAEFYNSVNAKWNDRWTTEGEVLDLKSVKKDIKNLVMGVMANSDTDAQYRNKLVKQTLLDVRTAYQLMKQDRTDVASYLLFHSAQRMIEGVEFIQDDTAFQEYKEIRDYLRTYRINAPEEFWENESFLEFRKEYYGRLRIGKGNSNIEDVYKDLADRWPHLFNETERENADLKDKPWELLQHIGVVVDSNVTPFMEAYSSEEAMSVITETADALYDIMAGGKEVVSLADSYKQRFDEKTKAMKQRHAEAILRERKIREEGIQKERQKYREWKQRDREKRKERQAHKTYFDRIKDTHDKLVERLTSNTADRHIPEQYKKELAKLLAAFDLQTEGSKAREARTGHVAQKTIRMAAIRSALKNIEDRSELFHVNDAVTDIMDSLSVVDGQTIDSLSAAELSNIDKLLRALLHEFNRYEKVKVGAKNMQAADLASAQTVSALEHAKLFGPGNDYYGAIGWLDRIINMDEVTPAYMFRRIDPNNTGLGLMWKEIRRSQDRYIRNTDQIQKWMDEITGKYKNKGRFNKKYGSDTIEQWRSTNYQQTFDVTNGTVTLTPAQAMSLYCLSKRNQAYGHMVGAGIVVAPVSFQAKLMSDLKRKINRSMPVILTDADIKTIVSSLTPEQIKVADQLQELMSTKMADMGNEASMNVLGIKLFNERDYFPIKSDKAALERDLSNEEFESAIRNFGFTKAVQPGARNAIMVEDIFDVVAEHCNNMNLYNAYSETLNDFMKVFNKHTIMEDGADYSVRQALAHAYSNKVPTYIMEFIRDINGNVSKGRQTGIDNAMSDMLGRAKQASVFANIRVLLQQPTAITRAFAVIDPKYLKGVSMKDVAKGSIPTVTTEVMQEMFEHCPIALWKSWGYYDINMGRSIEAVIMNEGNFLEDLATQAYGKADNVTWAAIWQMVKEEAKDLHPELKEGTSEFFEHCNERMSEIVDLTQVVDSPLHRSHLMRSKQVHHKILTAFMSEPTLTFNMLHDGLIRAREAWKKGDKAESSRIIGRIAGVAVLQATTVAAAAAIADALRGKGGDDDDDKGFGNLWLLNFIENLKDEAKVWNKIYYVKDLASIAEGWDNANLALQGWKTLWDGFRQLDKKLFEGSKTPWWKIYYNLLGGLGYFTGIPFKTLMKDGRSIFEMLGGELPESLVGEEKTSGVISSDSKLNSLRLFNSSDSDSSVSSIVRVDTGDKWYDYENNPITVRDGSALDKILNHFGINLTASEKAAAAASQVQKARDKTAEEIRGKYANLSGEERDKKVWSAVTTYFKSETEDSKAFSDIVLAGDYNSINEMRQIYIAAGGNTEYFDERVFAESKKALKKNIKYGESFSDINTQSSIMAYLQEHGMDDAELSEIAYKSDVAKDLKVAFRLNDENLMLESLRPLVHAGLTYDDLVRLYENRNKMQLDKYDGRYKDKLKSTGNFIWPTEGVITSHFGYRNAPTAGASSNHPAIDIGAPQGTAVVAADGGTVIYAGRNSGYGNSVGIKHDNGMVTYYNHLYSWNVKVGDSVGQGQQIAQVGSTGISTGPHLDFKILDANGEPVDPEKYLQKRQ